MTYRTVIKRRKRRRRSRKKYDEKSTFHAKPASYWKTGKKLRLKSRTRAVSSASGKRSSAVRHALKS